MLFRAMFFISTLCISALVSGQDGNHRPIDPPDLERVFTDNFSKDTRAEYKIHGDVSWEQGKLELGKATSIERSINGGAWAKVHCVLVPKELTKESPESELRVWFMLDGATNCYVRLRRELQDGKAVSSIALLDTGEFDGMPSEQLIREILVGEQSFRTVRVEYRNGLVRVSLPEEELFAGFIKNGAATVASATLEFPGSGAALIHFEAMASELTVQEFTSAEQELLAKAESNDNRMFSLYQEGNYTDAVTIGEQILKIKKSVLGEQHLDYAECLNNLAFLHDGAGDYARAETLHKQALKIRKLTVGEKHPYYALSVSNLASLYDRMGDYVRAEPLHKEALKVRMEVLGETHFLYAVSLNNLAFFYENIGDYARAAQFYKQAAAIYKAEFGEQHPDYATSLNNMARLNDRIGNYASAWPFHKQALQIRKSVLGVKHPDYSISLNNLARHYEFLGDYARAEPLYEEALDIAKLALSEQHPQYARSLNNLALLYENMGDYSRAELLYKQAIKIQLLVLGEQHPDYATSLSNLARLYGSFEYYARAETLLRQALEIRRSVLGEQHLSYATNLYNLASLQCMTGDFDSAKQLYEQAIEIETSALGHQHPSLANSLNNLALLHICLGENSRAMAQAIAARNVSLAAASQSIPILSGAEARKWMSSNAPRTDVVLSILRRSNGFESAEAYASVWQTKLMMSRLRVGREFPPDSSPAAYGAFTQLRDARLKLAKLVSATPSLDQAAGYRSALAEANENKELLEKELAQLNPASKRELAIRDASITDLLKQLPEGVAVVDFARLTDWSFVDRQIELKGDDDQTEKRTVKTKKATPVYDAFILRPGQRPANDTPARWIPLGPAEPIDRAIADWRQELAPVENGQESSRAAGPANILRELIWEKLEPHLKGIKTIAIIPDGALTRLPWAALPGRQADKFLIHDYALTTASSGQQLFGVLTDLPIEMQPSLLVAGGIQYGERPIHPSLQNNADLLAARRQTLDFSGDDLNWTYLNGTAAEAKAVTELWADRNSATRLEGDAADEKTLQRMLPQSRFAHLATHGFFDKNGDVYGVNLREQSLFQTEASTPRPNSSVAYRNPLLMTGIVMAGANVPPQKDEYGLPTGADGILTAEEISGLDLRNTELVTLSACESGLGDVTDGQGVFGLQRVLHQSGVRSVLASYWKVDDQATQELMRHFYTNLWIGKMSKIDALREAQLWMLQHPGELEALGVTGATRGKPRKLATDGPNRNPQDVSRTHPFFWASFQLSGDWR